MIEGLSHLTFIVRDLDRMENILMTVLEARKVYDSGANSFSISRERFYMVGAIWIAIMEGEALPTRTYNHVAFKIADGNYDTCLDRIKSLGLDARADRPRVEGEGRSIYFHDGDNHLFELHTGTLAERLKRYSEAS
jgi:fosfomycin resistance protein FosX